MRWSFRIARIAGIDIRIHATFFLLFGWIAFRAWSERLPASESLHMAALTAVMFAIIVLHELGHALTALAFGIRTHDITLLPIGGLARLERMPDKPSQEFLVAIAGPAVNVVLCAAAVGALAATGRQGDLWTGDIFRSGWLVFLAWQNAFLAAFNMLPAFPMDGGRVLRALLAMHFDAVTATGIAARLGQTVAVLFLVGGLAWGQPVLALIGVFVWIGARAEFAQVRFRAALAGLPVAHAMATEIRTLAPSDTLERAALFMMRGVQTDWPVMDGERPAGILSRNALVAAIGREGLSSPVSRAMSPDFAIVAPADSLDRAFVALQATPARAALVMQDGHLVGLLTPEDIGELAALQGAMREASKRGFHTPAP